MSKMRCFASDQCMRIGTAVTSLTDLLITWFIFLQPEMSSADAAASDDELEVVETFKNGELRRR